MDKPTQKLIKDFLDKNKKPSIYLQFEMKRDDSKDETQVLTIEARVDLATPRRESTGHGDVPLPHFQTKQFLNHLHRGVVNKKLSSITFQLLNDDIAQIITATEHKDIHAEIWEAAGFFLKSHFFHNLKLAGAQVPILGVKPYPSVPDDASESLQTAFKKEEEEWWKHFGRVSCTPTKFL